LIGDICVLFCFVFAFRRDDVLFGYRIMLCHKMECSSWHVRDEVAGDIILDFGSELESSIYVCGG